jgi:superfamily II DNA or RNA helicase
MGRAKEVIYYNDRYKGKYLDDETCDKLESLLKLQENKGYVKELKHIIYDLSASEVSEILESGYSCVDLEGKKGTLDTYQTIGIAYMFFAKRLILGDSVGLGKTVEVCGLCNLLEAMLAKKGQEFRFLLLTEKTAVPQVTKEMVKFTGNYIGSVQGEKRFVKKFIDANSDELHYSVVGSHSLLKSVDFQEYMRYWKSDAGYNPFDILIIDESGDILTNSATQYYKDAKYFEQMFDRVILLNATSFEKELMQFYNQLSFIDDSLLPTKTNFTKEYVVMDYTGPYPTPSGKYKNADRFRHLVGYRYFARTRKGIGATMKDCTADVVVTPLSKQQRFLLEKTSIPQMVFDCPSYFNMGIESTPETTPKLKALLDIVIGEWKDAKSILVYSTYKEPQRFIQSELAKLGISSEVMNGDVSQREREAIIDKFKLGDIRVLITNVQKSLNFGNCNHCIFYSYNPNTNSMVQFEGRMTRSFDIVDKHVKLLVSRGKELKQFKSLIADRAKASDVFAGSDYSCVLSILLDDENLKNLK